MRDTQLSKYCTYCHRKVETPPLRWFGLWLRRRRTHLHDECVVPYLNFIYELDETSPDAS